MKKNLTILFVFAVAMILFSSCAHVVAVDACVVGTKLYGFWNGLWHGMIAGFTFIGSLFDHNIAVYAVHNNGAWYNFGFLLGVGGLCGGGFRISR